MARSLSPSGLGVILSSLVVIGALGYMGYLFLVGTKAPEVPAVAATYKTDIITTELNPQVAKNVFTLTVPLSAGNGSQTGNIQYDKTELGKTDLSAVGK